MNEFRKLTEFEGWSITILLALMLVIGICL